MQQREVLPKCSPCMPELLHTILSEHLPQEARILDVGCGYGATLAYLQEHSRFCLYGIEPDAEACRVAQEGCAQAGIECAAAEQMPFGEDAFDALLLECVFSLLHAPGIPLEQIKRTLRPGGLLLLTDLYARRAGEGSIKNDPRVRHLYTKEKLEALLADAGFVLFGFWEESGKLGAWLAQSILEGKSESLPGVEARAKMKALRAGYGIWLFQNGKKEEW
ncbi:class I SAM-dependent methyltransferase [Christensenellaceae bacterium OttesenSCG-928-K19]|nr:class I SAM-dependent methyltransferase [Christensenellaceae bacterium OttesenSCG-928-K19]